MHIGTTDILIGSDPELFVLQNGVPVSGHDMIPGTKEEPYLVNSGAVQVDGLSLEFNTNPVSSKEDFIINIKKVINELSGMIPLDCELIAQSTVYFDKEYLTSLPEDVRKLGCDPDFNAYTGMLNPTPDDSVLFRTGAGHVHIGWGNNISTQDLGHRHMCETVVKTLDYFLGIPSVVLDEDRLRRELYGKAGAYRPKPYGVEYRVLSNFWTTSDDYISWVYDMIEHSLLYILEVEGKLTDIGGLVDKDVEQIINESDKSKALKFIKQQNIPLP